LHAVLEGGNVAIVGDKVSGLVRGVRVDVAADAAGVVAQAIGLGVEFREFGEGLDRAEVDFPARSI
jgi:hypothetical protein